MTDRYKPVVSLQLAFAIRKYKTLNYGGPAIFKSTEKNLVPGRGKDVLSKRTQSIKPCRSGPQNQFFSHPRDHTALEGAFRHPVA